MSLLRGPAVGALPLEGQDATDAMRVWSVDQNRVVQHHKVTSGELLCCHNGKTVRVLARLFKRPATSSPSGGSSRSASPSR